MLQLRAYATPDDFASVAEKLVTIAGVRHVIVGGRTAANMVLITCEIDVGAADAVVEALRACDLAADDVVLWRAAVGLVERRWGLAARAGLTLGIGLGVAALMAAICTAILRLLGRIDEGLQLADTPLGSSLTEVGPGAVLVALAAGMAGMLAYETAAGTAVGVAISVTTIPAAAYFGCSLGFGRSTSGLGALTVLGTNVLFIAVGSTLTMLVQRTRRARRRIVDLV